jgi:hypothetical protein
LELKEPHMTDQDRTLNQPQFAMIGSTAAFLETGIPITARAAPSPARQSSVFNEAPMLAELAQACQLLSLEEL